MSKAACFSQLNLMKNFLKWASLTYIPLIDLNLCLKNFNQKTVNLINQKGGSGSINFTRKIPGDISTFLKKTDGEKM